MAVLVRLGNLLGALGLVAILAVAFYLQFRFGDLPCPLCLLQRVAFVLCGFGFLLNLRFGAQPLHYGIVLLSALFGLAVAGRQILLHVAPGSGAYGSPVLGFHYYTWAFLLFAATVLGVALLLILSGDTRAHPMWHAAHNDHRFGVVARLVASLLILVTLANALATLALCGPIECPDNPASYWLRAKF